MNKKDFLSITDLTSSKILKVLQIALDMKKVFKKNRVNRYVNALRNKVLVMIFEKPSLRTRLSFEIGMLKLGGYAVYLTPQDIGLGKRESISDVANVVSRMGDIIMARVFQHETVRELAKSSQVPVINGLSDLEHPCQTLADLLTILELKEKLNGLKIAFVGDGDNNVPHSLALACALLGIHFTCASPKGFWMKKEIVQKAKKIAEKTKAKILETDNPQEAVKNADVVYTDTWISMGDESEKEKRLKVFFPYQVTETLMKSAKSDALFMHDLPAYRGNEVVSEVIDGKQSVIFQQAENRMWAQMALLYTI